MNSKRDQQCLTEEISFISLLQILRIFSSVFFGKYISFISQKKRKKSEKTRFEAFAVAA